MEKLKMKDLENVTGGVIYDAAGRPLTDIVCPYCGWVGLVETIDMDSPERLKVLECINCYNQYYRNEAGELVHHRRFLG